MRSPGPLLVRLLLYNIHSFIHPYGVATGNLVVGCGVIADAAAKPRHGVYKMHVLVRGIPWF